LEYVARDQLRAQGYVVFRLVGSRLVDLIAIKGGHIFLAECKFEKNPHFPPK
jgi:Holliday junction resolvase